ncbi:hypothetical protein [Sphingomonas sp. Sph1(2015)]|jgi:hypothetical protein|uniref:hypothetical protein n=1 Tax=Sphingomonas sp. Sph1(2015) TaxID=1628084 RepID=UPI000975BBFF|nr:hypothetical protein [Sphingomonas sp. Sph1(2015)]
MASRWYDSIERRQDMSFGYLLPGAHPTFVDHWRQAYGSGELAAGLPAQPARRRNARSRPREEVVPASEYWALQAQVSELQRLLGKKTMMEAEILRETVSRAAGPKKLLLRSTSLPGDGQ